MKLLRPDDDQVAELVMAEVDPGLFECRCGAAADWWGDPGPERWELVCDECLVELFEELNPTLADDETALDVFQRDIERRLGRTWRIGRGFA